MWVSRVVLVALLALAACSSSDDPTEEEPPDARRKGEDDVVDRQRGERQEEDWPSSEAIGQAAEDRAENEAHQREGREQEAVDRGGFRHIPAEHLLDELRQDRDEEAEAHGVDEQDPEDHPEAARIMLHVA